MVDISIAEALHLEGAELLVFSALSYLSSSKPWKGSSAELAALSRCGSKWTAQRALNSLTEKGYITTNAEGVSVQNAPKAVQNAPVAEQNAPIAVQNAPISKRKEPKENINNNISVCENKNIAPAHAHEVFLDSKEGTRWDKPTSVEEYKQYAKSINCPLDTYYLFYQFYESNGWKDVRNWRAKLKYWINKDKQKIKN